MARHEEARVVDTTAYIPTPNLQDWRKWRGLSMRELAARAGVDPVTIMRAEQRGHARPVTARKVAGVLGIDPAALREVPTDELASAPTPTPTEIPSPAPPSAGVPATHLRAWRLRRSLSQADLSALSGVSRSAIGRAEVGEGHVLEAATARRLADALRVTVEELGQEPA